MLICSLARSLLRRRSRSPPWWNDRARILRDSRALAALCPPSILRVTRASRSRPGNNGETCGELKIELKSLKCLPTFSIIHDEPWHRNNYVFSPLHDARTLLYIHTGAVTYTSRTRGCTYTYATFTYRPRDIASYTATYCLVYLHAYGIFPGYQQTPTLSPRLLLSFYLQISLLFIRIIQRCGFA